MTRIFDALMAPVAAWPAVAMVLVSLLTAVWALLLFKAVTPQASLQRVRDRLFGHIYEMGLYQDHLRVVARIQGDLARANLRYLALSVPALLVLTVPMVLTLAQLDSRFSHRSLAPGEVTVFSVTMDDAVAEDLGRLRLEASPGLRIEAGPVRDQTTGSLAWRVAVLTAGEHQLSVWEGDRELAGRVVPVATGLSALGETSRADWRHALLYPGAPALASGGLVTAMSLQLPARVTTYLGFPVDWLVAFMLCSLLSGLAVKDLLRVAI